MILIYEDAKKVINLGPGNWCVVECQDQEVTNEANPEDRRIVNLIMFVYPGGMGIPIAYPSAELRDEQFAIISKGLHDEAARGGGRNIVPVSLRPHPAQRGGPLIHTR